jgi:hypothetical protein
MPDAILHSEQGVIDTLEPEEDYDCENCGASCDSQSLFHNDNYGGALCESCDSEYTYICGNCGEAADSEEAAIECCMYRCESCGTPHDYEEDAWSCCGNSSEPAPHLAEMEHYQIAVPAIPGKRPARLCSLEQELAEGAAVVANLLYREGVCQEDYIRNYHSSSSSEAGEIHIEEDGSLPNGGGEVVYDRFNLSYGPHITRLSRVVGKIRQLRDEHKLVKTSFAAGIHVHVSVRDVNGGSLSTRDVAALYEVWCYAEDMLYSLSAAGWNRHRQPPEREGSGYCKAVPKVQGSATPTKVWRAMRADRYFGLNFQRLYNAVSNCSCGAATVGDWESCDCGAMDRATIEWRVFNASTLPRTIHAWIVMAQAITAYSKLHELGTLAQNEYGSQTASEKREVLNHLLDVLPLTEAEKDLIEEAADRSPGL